MESTSPVVVYLESIKKTDRKFRDVTTHIDDLHREVVLMQILTYCIVSILHMYMTRLLII